jgi:riboflavin synthase
VQGHVDGVAEVADVRQRDDALLVDLRLPGDLEPLMVPHGSVAIDGVSLTVNALPAPGILQVSLIDHSARHTTLGALRTGDAVHVEADMVGKYVRQLVAPYDVAR